MTNASKPFKKPEKGFFAARSPSGAGAQAAPPTRDSSAYLDRIEQASRTLVSSVERACELEELLYALKRRQDETNVQLEASRNVSAELERELADQMNRAANAEAIALSADNHAKQLDRALAEANSKLDALTAALDVALSEKAPVAPQLIAAA